MHRTLSLIQKAPALTCMLHAGHPPGPPLSYLTLLLVTIVHLDSSALMCVSCTCMALRVCVKSKWESIYYSGSGLILILWSSADLTHFPVSYIPPSLYKIGNNSIVYLDHIVSNEDILKAAWLNPFTSHVSSWVQGPCRQPCLNNKTK